MIEGSSELQYIIELTLDGMVDSGSNSALLPADRLARLRDRRTAWSSLNWKKRSVIQLQGLCHAYELVGGVFVKASGGHDFFASWLPSTTGEGRQLHRGDLKMEARDFAIDPGQDLIIFVEEASGCVLQPKTNSHFVIAHHRGFNAVARSTLTKGDISSCSYVLYQLTKHILTPLLLLSTFSYPPIASTASCSETSFSKLQMMSLLYFSRRVYIAFYCGIGKQAS